MGKRLRILFVTRWFPRPEQPLEAMFVRDHALAVQRFDDVAVLHWQGVESWPASRLERDQAAEQEANLRLYRLRTGRVAVPGLSYFWQSWQVVCAIRWVAENDFSPDVIHAHVYDTGLPAVAAGRLLRRPVVITEHFSVFPRRLLSRRELWKARAAFARADRVLPVSRALQEAIVALGVGGRFTVVPNVVDLDTFHPPSPAQQRAEMRRVLFVGRLNAVKGVPVLLHAARMLRTPSNRWHLDIVGEGPMRAAWQRMVGELEITDRVTFHGAKPRGQVAEMMRAAELLVLPSQWENLPVVVLEAMASGLPVVAADVGGTRELIDERSGLLVPPGDPAALAAALDLCLADGVRWDRQAIRRRAEAYGPEPVGRRIHEVYLECLRR